MKTVNLIKCNIGILLFIVVVFTPILGSAQKVEYKNIEKIAINAFSLNSGISKKSLEIKQVIPVSTNNEVSFYIFNFEPQGHIVISAEKFANPVLGYGLTSTIDLNNIPPGLNYLLDNFNREISLARKNKVKAEKNTEEKWGYYLNIEKSTSLKSYTLGSYLLTTTWGQGANYNASCPIDPVTGFRSVVGCGGVALGQLLYYWRDRVFPDGSVSYTPTNFTSPISVAFYNQNYNWQAMSTSSANSYNAYLLFHCAAALQSQFSSTSTSSYFDSHYSALRYNFGFNVSSSLPRSSYQLTDWINLLKTEIDAGRPLLYCGQATTGGHVWVIDGYKADNTFHCNWGWNGSQNSWYALSVMNTTNGNFNDYQYAMIGIYPKLGEVTGSDLVCTSNTTYSIGTPPGRVVWSNSSNLTPVGDNVSLTYIVKAASATTSGTGTVTASILNSQNQTVYTKTKTVWVGKPSAPVTSPTGYPIYQTGLGTRFVARVTSAPGASVNSGSWSCTGSIAPFSYTTGSSCSFDAVSLGRGDIYVTTSNTCGTSASWGIPVNVTSGGGGVSFAFSPNPATSNLVVEQLTNEEAESRVVLIPESTFKNRLTDGKNDDSYTIEIWHERKGKVKTLKSKSKRQDIDISKLEKGKYFLHIITQTAIYKEHFLIQ